MVYQMPFVLSRNSMERLGRLVLPANGALRWLLIFGLISSVALQVVMVAQAPNEGYRPYLSAFVLLMQVGVALTVRTAYAGMPILSTRTRDGAPWQRRSAGLWLLAQVVVLAGFVTTAWASQALSIVGGGVIVALLLFMAGSHRVRTQQIATARAELVQRLTDLRSVYGPGCVPTLSEVRGPLLAFQDLCNEDLSDPRAGLLGRTLVDGDLSLVADYCVCRMLGCPESVRQLECAEFFQNGSNGKPGLDSSSVDDLIAAFGEFVEELRHRLHHPFLTARQVERFAKDSEVARGWNAFSR